MEEDPDKIVEVQFYHFLNTQVVSFPFLQTHEEMRRLILTQAQLKRLQSLDYDLFREAVVGFYVRVNVAGLPSKTCASIFVILSTYTIIFTFIFKHMFKDRQNCGCVGRRVLPIFVA